MICNNATIDVSIVITVTKPAFDINSQSIFHITHMSNLSSIFSEEGLWSDKELINRSISDRQVVGMENIKSRRLNNLEVSCHSNTFVGDFVPFYFCPRSIMLYIIYKKNHEGITYTGGQDFIVHLEFKLNRVIEWLESSKIRWAFSDRNAGAYLAEFSNDVNDLTHLNWNAIKNRDFRDATVKEFKQAEFLVHSHLPIDLITGIGVYDEQIKQRIEEDLKNSKYRHLVVTKRNWYY